MARRVFYVVLGLAAIAVLLGLGFAGSPGTIAKGVVIDGVAVGGLSTTDAQTLLERRSRALASTPLVFTANGKRFPIRANDLGVEADWRQAVEIARRQGDGFGPVRGFRRLDVQVFGAEIEPPTSVLNGALQYKLGLIAREVDRPALDAALVRRGGRIVAMPARAGVVLDRAAASRLVVRRLATLERDESPVSLPLRRQAPQVTAAGLARAARQARVATSAPVRLTLGRTRWLLEPARIASLLRLPSQGATTLRIGGPAAERWLAKLGARVGREPKDATFQIVGGRPRVVPAQPGVRIDAAGAADAVLAAALRSRNRVAELPVVTAQPRRTTQAARAMRIRGVVGTYTTEYGGVPNRIYNVNLVSRMIDGALIAPGETFSFNKTTGDRSAATGFRAAPVIINGELTTGIGGGVCQVSTTVFNAAYEAGLKIVERTNHALYIAHYPQGRDATVNYPDLDVKFVNDTRGWLLLRAFVGPSSLTVTLYGTPTGRRVLSTPAPLRVLGGIPVKRTVDPSLEAGERVVDSPGQPARSTSVTREVYAANGKLLYDDTWYSSYQAEPKVVRVGPAKPKPKPKRPRQPQQRP